MLTRWVFLSWGSLEPDLKVRGCKRSLSDRKNLVRRITAVVAAAIHGESIGIDLQVISLFEIWSAACSSAESVRLKDGIALTV